MILFLFLTLASATDLFAPDCGARWLPPANATAMRIITSASNPYDPRILSFSIGQARDMCVETPECRGIAWIAVGNGVYMSMLLARDDALKGQDFVLSPVASTGLVFGDYFGYANPGWRSQILDRNDTYACSDPSLDLYHYYFGEHRAEIEAWTCPVYAKVNGSFVDPPVCLWRTNATIDTNNPTRKVAEDDPDTAWQIIAAQHWRRYGYAQRLSPRAGCVLTPTLYTAESLCKSPQPYCYEEFYGAADENARGLPCSGHGVCTDTGCQCYKFKEVSAAMALPEYDTYINDVFKDQAAFRGAACQFPVEGACMDRAQRKMCNGGGPFYDSHTSSEYAKDAQGNVIWDGLNRCKDEPILPFNRTAMLLNRGDPVYSTGLIPEGGDAYPRCDCDTAADYKAASGNQAFGPFYLNGSMCTLPRCGVEDCNNDLGHGTCVVSPSSCTDGRFCPWLCRCVQTEATGPTCASPVTTCIEPGKTSICSDGGVCMPPDVNHTNSWCKCNAAFSGQYCTSSLCTEEGNYAVVRGHGVCATLEGGQLGGYVSESGTCNPMYRTISVNVKIYNSTTPWWHCERSLCGYGGGTTPDFGQTCDCGDNAIPKPINAYELEPGCYPKCATSPYNGLTCGSPWAVNHYKQVLGSNQHVCACECDLCQDQSLGTSPALCSPRCEHNGIAYSETDLLYRVGGMNPPSTQKCQQCSNPLNRCSFKCDCTNTGYTGTTCQNPICKNNGTWRLDGSCNCLSVFKDGGACVTNQCTKNGHGTVRNTALPASQWTCACNSGFSYSNPNDPTDCNLIVPVTEVMPSSSSSSSSSSTGMSSPFSSSTGVISSTGELSSSSSTAQAPSSSTASSDYSSSSTAPRNTTETPVTQSTGLSTGAIAGISAAGAFVVMIAIAFWIAKSSAAGAVTTV